MILVIFFEIEKVVRLHDYSLGQYGPLFLLITLVCSNACLNIQRLRVIMCNFHFQTK